MESNSDTDKKLLQGLKVGDEKSFRQIYERYHRQLYSIALKYLRSKDLADDAVHDIFLKLWDNRKKLDPSGSLKGFLFTAIKNHVLNMIGSNKRKLKKHIKLSYEKKASKIKTDNVVVLAEYRDLYQMAIGQLPDKRREVFELRTDEGLTNKEVAEYLEISIHTVKSQYYKATKFIQKYVRQNISSETGS